MARTPLVLALAGALLLTAGCSKAADTSASATTTTAAATASTTTTAATDAGSGTDGGGRSTTTAGSSSGASTGVGSGGKSFLDQIAQSNLPASVTTCLTGKADSDADFKTVVEGKSNPSLAQAKVAMPIILTCMTKEQFATLVIGTTSTSISPAGATCLTGVITGLSTDELAGLSAGDDAAMQKIYPQIAACAKA